MIISRLVVVDRKIFERFIVRLTYDNHKVFCKLDVRRKSIVTLALSYNNRKIVVRYFVNRATEDKKNSKHPIPIYCLMQARG